MSNQHYPAGHPPAVTYFPARTVTRIAARTPLWGVTHLSQNSPALAGHKRPLVIPWSGVTNIYVAGQASLPDIAPIHTHRRAARHQELRGVTW
ncbi:hypothetical protein STBA_71130 [Streptomyces sp. MP131-18]|nr:hypothetical protein STBA_71130 [Streptomyces sp. MP131-18]